MVNPNVSQVPTGSGVADVLPLPAQPCQHFQSSTVNRDSSYCVATLIGTQMSSPARDRLDRDFRPGGAPLRTSCNRRDLTGPRSIEGSVVQPPRASVGSCVLDLTPIEDAFEVL